MDSIANLGRSVFEAIEPTYKAYGDILRQTANSAAIHNTKKTTYSYGPHERQKLDHYEPGPNAPQPPAGKGRPILVFAYGGGFSQGEKVLLAVAGNVMYTNVGSFFADRLGYDTIIMDYRLLSHGARYPSGGEDVNGVLEWVVDHFKQQRDVFLMGNSAGGAHVGTWLFAPEFESRRKEVIRGISGVKLTGVIFLGSALSFSRDMAPIFINYYGDEATMEKGKATALMTEAVKDASPKEKGNWPHILIIVSEFDPEILLDSAEDFKRQWEERGGEEIEIKTLKGHNHISPPASLGTNIEKEEAWGFDLEKWMKAHASQT